MEDPNMEWSLIEQEEEEDREPEESTMSMILSKGWSIGKKIVITGVAISSAPMVLPPLMVFSTIGFAFALPFGFVFASYACTQKIMSKLLSRPKPPLMLEFKVDEYDDDVEFDDKRGYYLDEEEKKFIDDTNETLENRFELIGDEHEEKEEEGYDVGEEGYGEEDMGGVMEEERRDDTWFENYVQDEEKMYGGVEGVMGEYGDEGKPIEGTMGDYEVEEKPIGQVLEEIRGEENWKKVLEDEQKMVSGVYDEKGRRDRENGVKSIEEEEEEEIEEEVPLSVTNGYVEESIDEGNADIMVEQDRPEIEREKPTGENIEEGKGPMRETEGMVEENRDDGTSGKAIGEGEIPVVEMQQIAVEIGDELNIKDVAQKDDYTVMEKERPKRDINIVVEEKRTDDGKDVGHAVVVEEKKPVKQTKKRVLPSKTGDAREVADESGLHPVSSEIAESTSTKGVSEGKKAADFVVHPVSSEIAAQSSSTKGVSQEEKSTIPSKEVLYSEEKIWEQIDAMRKIVGYKAAIQSTSMEELKALYVFTGVEPPLTFKDPTDLVEINDKLRLLMSIVGVK